MAILTKPPANGSHFYHRDGTPCHTVLDAKGEPRNTRITDARKLRLLPSVTGKIDMVYSFGLEDWKLGQVAIAAGALPRNGGESEEHWVKRVKAQAFAQVDDARDMGSRVHKALESHERGEPYDQELEVYVRPVVEWQAGLDVRVVEVEKVVVNLSEGYAGTADKLFTFGKDGVGAIDYKTKKTKPGKKVEAYATQGMQLAAYIAAYFGPDRLKDALAANVYISTTEPGRMEVVKHKNLEGLYEAFLHVCGLWRTLKGYDPRAGAE